jgi:hypothetical protein
MFADDPLPLLAVELSLLSAAEHPASASAAASHTAAILFLHFIPIPPVFCHLHGTIRNRLTIRYV